MRHGSCKGPRRLDGSAKPHRGVSQELSLSPALAEETGSERLDDLPEVIQLGNGSIEATVLGFFLFCFVF